MPRSALQPFTRRCDKSFNAFILEFEMDLENALSHIKELSESHGAKCYLDACDTISKALAEALKPSHNISVMPCDHYFRGDGEGGVTCLMCNAKFTIRI